MKYNRTFHTIKNQISFYLSYGGLKIPFFQRINWIEINSNFPYHFALQFNPDF